MSAMRVLVVDDSALMRRLIGDIIQEQPDLTLAATACNGQDALKKIETVQPHVVTLDVEMPLMDGIETLQRIMAAYPLPVIMVSSHTREGSESTLKALSAGAVDFIPKPAMSSLEDSIEELRGILPQKIRAAASIKPEFITAAKQPSRAAIKLPPSEQSIPARALVAIGASTGGPKALELLFSTLPADLPAAVMLCLHMPPGFTMAFANRLDMLSPLQVREAAAGDAVTEGKVLLAPGGFHMKLRGGTIALDAGPKVNFVRPAVDVMLESLVDYPHGIVVVILTGMGKDGAAGAARLKQEKKDTVILVQDPGTAIIPSMPEAAITSTGCAATVPLSGMAAEIMRQAVRIARR
ncbi:MAG: chemotaxis response regulator protein-glutamate methylesterase [Bacillota bacterium]